MTFDEVLQEQSIEYKLKEIIEDLLYEIEYADKIETVCNTEAYRRAVKVVEE